MNSTCNSGQSMEWPLTPFLLEMSNLIAEARRASARERKIFEATTPGETASDRAGDNMSLFDDCADGLETLFHSAVEGMRA